MKSESIYPNDATYLNNIGKSKYSTVVKEDESFTTKYIRPVVAYVDAAKKENPDFVFDPKNLPDKVEFALEQIRSIKNVEGFLDHIVGLLGNIKVVMDGEYVMPGKTLSPDNVLAIKYKDMLYSFEDIIIYLKFFRELNWTHWTRKSQSQKSKYNSAVPLLLYSQRLYNNVPYDAWNRGTHYNQSTYGLILGKALAPIVPDEAKLGDQFKDLITLRRQMATGMINGEKTIYPFNAYKCNLTVDHNWNNFSKVFRMMLGQLWIFNGQLRNKNMILNPFNWDEIPDDLDLKTHIRDGDDVGKDDAPEETMEDLSEW